MSNARSSLTPTRYDLPLTQQQQQQQKQQQQQQQQQQQNSIRDNTFAIEDWGNRGQDNLQFRSPLQAPPLPSRRHQWWSDAPP